MKINRNIVSMLIPIIFGIFMHIIVNLIIGNLIKSYEDEIIMYITGDKWLDTYYDGTGHGDKVEIDSTIDMLDNGSQQVRILLSLDNFTKDSFDIKERFLDMEIHYRLYYWLSFNYKTFSTSCKEVRNDMVVFPSSISSPRWWPKDLKKSFFQNRRSKYTFYRCYAVYASDGISFFHYFAIDTIHLIGYYWKIMLTHSDKNDINKCYYDWEIHR